MSKIPNDELGTYHPELLKELHILTRDGQLNQDSRRKLKQVDHLGHLCFEQLLGDRVKDTETPFTLCDVGAGKNYFSFMIWDKYLKRLGDKVSFFTLETRKELNTRSVKIAQNIGIPNFHALQGRAHECLEQLPHAVDFLLALHACDTATDEAILLALQKEIPFVALVPCCQAEVARKLQGLPQNHELYQVWRHAIHRREFGSHLTNVVRCLVLEAHGYKVRTTEFTGLEHSLKNEVIVGEKVQRSNKMANKALQQIVQKFHLEEMFLMEQLALK